MTIERTVKVATIVATIEEAFAFVITHMDAEAMQDPSITINPIWVFNEDCDGVRRFEVSVSSMRPHSTHQEGES